MSSIFNTDDSKKRARGPSLISMPSKQQRKADHALSMKKIYIHQIREGSKDIEVRINKGPVKNLACGRTIRFYYMSNAQDDVVCKISKICNFKTFKEMLEQVDYKRCVPSASSKQEALKIYRSIPGYLEKEALYNIRVIYLEKIEG